MRGLDALRSTGLAVVGLDTTTGTPPLLVEVAVFHLAGPVITGGPFGFWVQPDAPLAQVRRDARQDVWRAPPWAEVAEHVIDTLVGRVLVLHDPDRLSVLSRHLPEWQPAAVLFGRALVGHARPGLNPTRTGQGAVIEAHTLAQLGAAVLLVPPRPATAARCPPGRPGGGGWRT